MTITSTASALMCFNDLSGELFPLGLSICRFLKAVHFEYVLDVTKFVLFVFSVKICNYISALSVQRYNFFFNNTTINIFFLVISWWGIQTGKEKDYASSFAFTKMPMCTCCSGCAVGSMLCTYTSNKSLWPRSSMVANCSFLLLGT